MQAIKNNYLAIHNHFIPLMLSTEEPLLRERVVKEINPIIWMAWHIIRTEDMYLNTVVFDQPQVFHEFDWLTRLKAGTSNTGTGMSPKDADELSQRLDKKSLLDYNDEVGKRSMTLLERSIDLDDDLFAGEEEIEHRLKVADVFPQGVMQERAKAYAQFPLASGITGIAMHGFMHIGQYQIITKPL